jgi:hypothetical protein
MSPMKGEQRKMSLLTLSGPKACKIISHDAYPDGKGDSQKEDHQHPEHLRNQPAIA